MKKLLILFAILSPPLAIALPIGNPAEAPLLNQSLFFNGRCFNYGVGFYGDTVFERHLRVNLSTTSEGTQLPTIDHASLNTNAGYIVFDFFQWLDIFATVGVSKFSLNTDASAFMAITDSRLTLESNSTFSWSMGGNLTLWECGSTAMGFETQYFHFNPQVSSLSLDETLSIYPSNISILYTEWQLGLGISHRIGFLVPYVAIKYNKAFLAFKGPLSFAFTTLDVGTLRDLVNAKRWGYAIGTTLVDFYKMSVTTEARFADEKALYINAQIRF